MGKICRIVVGKCLTDLVCAGFAKKIERSLSHLKGNMSALKNEIKGV
jgi:hypothetical protein